MKKPPRRRLSESNCSWLLGLVCPLQLLKGLAIIEHEFDDFLGHPVHRESEQHSPGQNRRWIFG